MKTRGGRRDGAGMGRVDGLITLTVERFGFPLAPHVGRQRRFAEHVQLRRRTRRRDETQDQSGRGRDRRSLRRSCWCQNKQAAHLRFLRAIDNADPEASAFIGKAFEQQHFDFAAAVFAADEPRRKNFGIVQHQQIAGVEKVAKSANTL